VVIGSTAKKRIYRGWEKSIRASVKMLKKGRWLSVVFSTLEYFLLPSNSHLCRVRRCGLKGGSLSGRRSDLVDAQEER